MLDTITSVDAAIVEADRLRRVLKKSRNAQVRSSDERALAKATALAWFQNHRGPIDARLATPALADVDAGYRTILESSARDGARSKYVATLGQLKKQLIRLRTDCMTAEPPTATTSDLPPDFSPLIADVDMQRILVARWNECTLCLNAQASLSATVMMGGLLEGLLLARINRESDKSRIFVARAAPKEKTGATKPLDKWMLNDFIQVVSELKWISVSAKSVGVVLRDYRNYIHPQKQLSHGVHLTPEDATLFWEISKNITHQVIASVGR
jgi:hypothetical protein